jgi:hypothetical protein
MKEISSKFQDRFFKMPKSELGGHQDPLSLLPTVFQPNFELDNFPDRTELVAIFWDSPAPNLVNFHLIFRDEVLPFSKRIDEAYRKLRENKLGRTTDIESFSVRIGLFNVPRLTLPLDYSLTPIYHGNVHYASTGIPWVTGQIYSSTFNHLLDQFGRYLSPVIRFFGGYRIVEPPVVREGTRVEATKFVPV